METGRQIQRGGGGERDRDSVTERDGLGVGWTKKQSLRVRTKPMGTAWRVEGWKEGMAKRANDGPTVVVVIVAVYRFLLLCLALSLSLSVCLLFFVHIPRVWGALWQILRRNTNRAHALSFSCLPSRRFKAVRQPKNLFFLFLVSFSLFGALLVCPKSFSSFCVVTDSTG